MTILSVLDKIVDLKRAKSRLPATTTQTVTATEAKTRFGPLLETVIRRGAVVITKHDAPKAVLLSIAEFDGLVARLQTPGSRRALKSAFEASPRELGRLAVANRRRRG